MILFVLIIKYNRYVLTLKIDQIFLILLNSILYWNIFHKLL